MDGWMPVNSKIFACGGRGRNKRFTYGLREKNKKTLGVRCHVDQNGSGVLLRLGDDCEVR
jgi:hypothetical protein